MEYFQPDCFQKPKDAPETMLQEYSTLEAISLTVEI